LFIESATKAKNNIQKIRDLGLLKFKSTNGSTQSLKGESLEIFLNCNNRIVNECLAKTVNS
jgi:hypothetical protein